VAKAKLVAELEALDILASALERIDEQVRELYAEPVVELGALDAIAGEGDLDPLTGSIVRR
jgi:hypothetical protein